MTGVRARGRRYTQRVVHQGSVSCGSPVGMRGGPGGTLPLRSGLAQPFGPPAIVVSSTPADQPEACARELLRERKSWARRPPLSAGQQRCCRSPRRRSRRRSARPRRRPEEVVRHDVADAGGARAVVVLDVVAVAAVRDHVVPHDVVVGGQRAVAREDDPFAVSDDQVPVDQRPVGVRVELDPAVGVVVDLVVGDSRVAGVARDRDRDRGSATGACRSCGSGCRRSRCLRSRSRARASRG